MKSLRSVATAQLDPPPKTSVKALAGTVNIHSPASVTAIIAALSAPVSFHADIRTPSGTWRHSYMSCFSGFFLRPFQTTSISVQNQV